MKSIPALIRKQADSRANTEKEITQAFRTVMDYYSILKEWREKYAPIDDEKWDEHFVKPKGFSKAVRIWWNFQ